MEQDSGPLAPGELGLRKLFRVRERVEGPGPPCTKPQAAAAASAPVPGSVSAAMERRSLAGKLSA